MIINLSTPQDVCLWATGLSDQELSQLVHIIKVLKYHKKHGLLPSDITNPTTAKMWGFTYPELHFIHHELKRIRGERKFMTVNTQNQEPILRIES